MSADRSTFAIYDASEGFIMCGIPSIDVARSIVSDVYRRLAEWDSFLEEEIPKQEIIFTVDVDGVLLFGYSNGFIGSISVERRRGCCGHVIDRSVVKRAGDPT